MLPSVDDNVFITSLMQASLQPGQYAGWIAPPRQGMDNMPGDFEYVRLVSCLATLPSNPRPG